MSVDESVFVEELRSLLSSRFQLEGVLTAIGHESQGSLKQSVDYFVSYLNEKWGTSYTASVSFNPVGSDNPIVIDLYQA